MFQNEMDEFKKYDIPNKLLVIVATALTLGLTSIILIGVIKLFSYAFLS